MTPIQETTLQIRGIECACSAREIESGVGHLNGVQSSEFNYTTQRLRVVGAVTREALIEKVRELGYRIYEPPTADEVGSIGGPPAFFRYMVERLETRLALVGAILIFPGVLFGELLGLSHPLLTVTSIGALLTAGWPIAKSGWRSLREGHGLTINALMSIASVGAVVIGAFNEAGMVMVLFAIGEALEGYTAGKARQAIRSIMEIVPEEATVLEMQGDHSHTSKVEVGSIAVGDTILVKPGDRIPMDGRVVSGMSSVNQAPLTGESRWLAKSSGSKVFASSINGEGTLEIEVTHLAEDNAISRVIQMVEAAQERRAPVQRFVDRFAKYYTPAVVVLASLIAILPPLLFNQPLLNSVDGSTGWLYRGLALLVVACPCALVISTPVTLISAISNAARNGVLIKGGLFVEVLNRVKAVGFDKTGTLTEGLPSVVSARSSRCASPQSGEIGRCEGCDDLVALASSVERHSEHPLSRAIVNESIRRNVIDRYPPAMEVRALPGYGVTGRVNGHQVMIGSHRYFDEGVSHPKEDCDDASRDEERGYSTVMVSENGGYLGTIVLADTARESSQEAVRALKDLGIESLVMLTGDHRAAARAIAASIGLENVRSELMPDEKVSVVKELQRDYGEVAMIGDGINDAPALATADVGIALGAATGGTAQAMETADITLMSADLRQVPFTFELSRKAMKTVYTNVALSLGIKLVFLLLVLFGLGTMWMAVLADMGTSLIVTLNGMRLLRRPRSVIGEG